MSLQKLLETFERLPLTRGTSGGGSLPPESLPESAAYMLSSIPGDLAPDTLITARETGATRGGTARRLAERMGITRTRPDDPMVLRSYANLPSDTVIMQINKMLAEKLNIIIMIKDIYKELVTNPEFRIFEDEDEFINNVIRLLEEIPSEITLTNFLKKRLRKREGYKNMYKLPATVAFGLFVNFGECYNIFLEHLNSKFHMFLTDFREQNIFNFSDSNVINILINNPPPMPKRFGRESCTELGPDQWEIFVQSIIPTITSLYLDYIKRDGAIPTPPYYDERHIKQWWAQFSTQSGLGPQEWQRSDFKEYPDESYLFNRPRRISRKNKKNKSLNKRMAKKSRSKRASRKRRSLRRIMRNTHEPSLRRKSPS